VQTTQWPNEKGRQTMIYKTLHRKLNRIKEEQHL